MDAWTLSPDAVGDGPGRWEQNYRTIFETSGSGMAVFEEDMTVSMVNREFERLTGYGREELLGRPWTGFVAPGDLERMNSCHARLRSHPGEAPGRYSLSLLDRKGGWREMSATVNVIPETGRIVASFFDVSELKRLNRALEDSERMYRLLADNVNDVIWTLDTTLRYTYVSPSVERIRGFRVEEMLNQPLRKSSPPPRSTRRRPFFSRNWSPAARTRTSGTASGPWRWRSSTGTAPPGGRSSRSRRF